MDSRVRLTRKWAAQTVEVKAKSEYTDFDWIQVYITARFIWEETLQSSREAGIMS